MASVDIFEIIYSILNKVRIHAYWFYHKNCTVIYYLKSNVTLFYDTVIINYYNILKIKVFKLFLFFYNK